MIAPCLITVFCGVLLGLRFKVAALLAFQVLILGVLLTLVALDRTSVGQAVLFFIGWSACLQVSYLVTLFAAAALRGPVPVTRTSKA